MMAQTQCRSKHIVTQDIQTKVSRNGQLVMVIQNGACGVDAYHPGVGMPCIESRLLDEWNVQREEVLSQLNIQGRCSDHIL
jgi:hypothetical protein